jgi:hypothetical protein
MGCDIHLHQEVKINGVWHHYGCPSVGRSYRLFALMADVRNNGEVEPIAKQKGVPSDITELTKFDLVGWEDDGHSHSWLSAGEIELLYDFLDSGHIDDLGYVFGYPWNHIPLGVDDFRFVFWFDC